MYPLTVLAAGFALISVLMTDKPLRALLNLVLSVLVGGGIFYVIFQVSSGRWIGGGDVKLGWLLGLIMLTPARSLLMIFLAALAGSLVSLPLMLSGRLKQHATIPFGPFLILGAVLVQLYGSNLLQWYQGLLGL